MSRHPFFTELGPQAGTMEPINLANFRRFLKIGRRDPQKVWKKLEPYLVPGQPFENTQKLINILNTELHVGFSPKEEFVFSALAHQLIEVRRFLFNGKPDAHHPKDFLNTVGIHSSSVCVWEGLSIFLQVLEDMRTANKHPERIAEEWRGWVIRTLMHDVGEIVMEFSSLGDESALSADERKEKSRDKKAIEAEITAFFTRLSLYAAIDEKHEKVTEAVQYLRHEIAKRKANDPSFDYFAVASLMRDFMQNYDFAQNFKGADAFTDIIDMRVTQYMEHYSQAEDFRGVTGVGVKIAQSTDSNNVSNISVKRGIRLEAEGNEDVVPYFFAQNARILSTYDRSEKELKTLFGAVVSDDAKMMIAKRLAKRNYAVLIDHICIGPPVVHRTEKSGTHLVNTLPFKSGERILNPARVDVLAGLWREETRLSARDDFQRAANAIFERPTMSARTQMLLYAAAYANDTNMEEFLKENTRPLVYAERVPRLLEAYVPIIAHAFENDIDLRDADEINTLRGQFTFREDTRYLQAIEDIKNNADELMRFFSQFREWQQGYLPRYCAREGLLPEFVDDMARQARAHLRKA
ncbi:MAG: hypothetical protein GC136_09890 [Alphaproteobacteria bacterium]|nr:hypothetical protein [Alphaproteobacteria bacterium]